MPLIIILRVAGPPSTDILFYSFRIRAGQAQSRTEFFCCSIHKVALLRGDLCGTVQNSHKCLPKWWLVLLLSFMMFFSLLCLYFTEHFVEEDDDEEEVTFRSRAKVVGPLRYSDRQQLYEVDLLASARAAFLLATKFLTFFLLVIWLKVSSLSDRWDRQQIDGSDLTLWCLLNPNTLRLTLKPGLSLVCLFFLFFLITTRLYSLFFFWHLQFDITLAYYIIPTFLREKCYWSKAKISKPCKPSDKLVDKLRLVSYLGMTALNLFWKLVKSRNSGADGGLWH